MKHLYSKDVKVRFAEDCLSVYIWTPYNEGFIRDLKQTFNSKEAMGTAYGCDPGAEWDCILEAWHIHTGWKGCEDWYDKLIMLLNRYFPENENHL